MCFRSIVSRLHHRLQSHKNYLTKKLEARAIIDPVYKDVYYARRSLRLFLAREIDHLDTQPGRTIVHDVHTEPVVVELHPMEPVLVKVNATVIVIDREIAQEDQAVVILEA